MVQQGSIEQTYNDIEPALLEFLRTRINSFVKWDLIRFFHDNPHAMETAENIARFTARDNRSVESALAGLVDTGVLRLKQVASQRIYQLSNDPGVQDLVERFLLACDDRNFRVRAINQVISEMH